MRMTMPEIYKKILNEDEDAVDHECLKYNPFEFHEETVAIKVKNVTIILKLFANGIVAAVYLLIIELLYHFWRYSAFKPTKIYPLK